MLWGFSVSDLRYELQYSASFGQLDILKYLITLNHSIDDLNEYALVYSAMHSHINVVEFLIEFGCDYTIHNYIIFKNLNIIEDLFYIIEDFATKAFVYLDSI